MGSLRPLGELPHLEHVPLLVEDRVSDLDVAVVPRIPIISSLRFVTAEEEQCLSTKVKRVKNAKLASSRRSGPQLLHGARVVLLYRIRQGHSRGWTGLFEILHRSDHLNLVVLSELVEPLIELCRLFRFPLHFRGPLHEIRTSL